MIVPVAHDCFSLLLTLILLRYLLPHLLNVFQDHVTVTVERLNASKQLLVVSAVDQNSRPRLDSISQD
jgi:hypothetical protein